MGAAVRLPLEQEGDEKEEALLPLALGLSASLSLTSMEPYDSMEWLWRVEKAAARVATARVPSAERSAWIAARSNTFRLSFSALESLIPHCQPIPEIIEGGSDDDEFDCAEQMGAVWFDLLALDVSACAAPSLWDMRFGRTRPVALPAVGKENDIIIN